MIFIIDLLQVSCTIWCSESKPLIFHLVVIQGLLILIIVLQFVLTQIILRVHRFIFINPLGSFSILPHANSDGAVREHVLALPVLFAVPPITFVATSVGPDVHTEAVLFVQLIKAFVLASVFPSIDSVSVHVIVLPGACVHTAVHPSVNSRAFNAILEPVAVVGAAIGPHIGTLAVLLSFPVVSLIA